MVSSPEITEIPIVPYNSSYQPLNQTFTLTLADGRTKIYPGIDEFETLRMLSVYQAISAAVQVGAATVLLAAIFLMTKSEKRRSSVFILNSFSLLLVFCRAVFQLATVCGPFYEWFRWETHTYFDMGNARGVSVGTEVSALILTIAILLSLFVQVRIVCCNLSDARRYIINGSNSIVIATAVAMRFVVTVLNIKWNIINITPSYEAFRMMGHFASAANISLVLAIAFSTVIFTGKLASAIIARRSMGMKQFGPMQIIFVMGCQTMFTPLIFTILCYTALKNASIQSFVPTIVAISLPLSGMWAAVNTDNIHIASPDSRKHRVVPVGGFNDSYGGSSATKGISTSSTYYDDDKYGLTTVSPKKGGSNHDLEMQRIRDGVSVERTYSVRSD